MALWQRRPRPGTIHQADHGAQYTSWAFGQRLREAGLLGSMGTVGDALDSSVAESFFATLPTEYFHPESLRQEYPAQPDESLCPWKGLASYDTITVGDVVDL